MQNQYGESDATESCNEGERHALTENLLKNVGWSGTDGSTDADFSGALLHGHHHDVAHTDGSTQEGAETNHPHQDADAIEEVVHHGEHRFCVDEKHCLFVGRMYGMGIANESADFLLHLAHLETLSCRHAKHLDFVASSVSAAQGSERNFNGGQGIAIETDAISRTAALPYDGIGNAVDLYFLAASICLAGKKRFHNAGTDDAHLSVLHHVDIVESPSCLDARVVYFVIFREDATQAHAKRLVTLHGTASPVVARSCADIHLGNAALHTVDVFQVQTP